MPLDRSRAPLASTRGALRYTQANTEEPQHSARRSQPDGMRPWRRPNGPTTKPESRGRRHPLPLLKDRRPLEALPRRLRLLRVGQERTEPQRSMWALLIEVTLPTACWLRTPSAPPPPPTT